MDGPSKSAPTGGLVSIQVPEFDAGFGDLPGLLSGFGNGNGDGNGSLGRGGGDRFIANDGGMEVRAVKLGRILDVSGSMRNELRAIR